MITISLSTHHHKAWRISKTLYHSSWPYGLSSLLTDCIKSKHLDQRQKKTTTAKFGSRYTCNPKCFDLTLVLSLQNISDDVSCGKGSRRKNVILTLTP